jgi:hypothetical protein
MPAREYDLASIEAPGIPHSVPAKAKAHGPEHIGQHQDDKRGDNKEGHPRRTYETPRKFRPSGGIALRGDFGPHWKAKEP